MQEGKYNVTDITCWYVDRITRYDPTYRAVQTIDPDTVLAATQAEDRDCGAAFT